MRQVLQTLIVGVAAVATLVAQDDAQAIQRMVATERAFAAATGELGVRDGFLTFFADDAIQLDAGATGAETTVSRAKDALRTLAPPKLPLGTRLMWEPFTGQVSNDGSIGWLTGGYVSQNQLTRNINAQGAYFSVWRRQSDGTWRVWLDEGIALPQVWNDATPFRAAPDPDPGTAGRPTESLEEAERAVSAGGADWAARLAESVRLHRGGVMPIVGREAAVAWAGTTWTSVRFTVARAERSGSGDLGVAMGGYDATTAAGPEHGTWVRVWKRDVTDHWRIVFETSQAH
jgi:hypothetical protein